MDSVMKLSTSSRCVKYLMFIFNLLFVVSSFILVSCFFVFVFIHSFLRTSVRFYEIKRTTIATVFIDMAFPKWNRYSTLFLWFSSLKFVSRRTVAFFDVTSRGNYRSIDFL